MIFHGYFHECTTYDNTVVCLTQLTWQRKGSSCKQILLFEHTSHYRELRKRRSDNLTFHLTQLDTTQVILVMHSSKLPQHSNEMGVRWGKTKANECKLNPGGWTYSKAQWQAAVWTLHRKSGVSTRWKQGKKQGKATGITLQNIHLVKCVIQAADILHRTCMSLPE